MCCTCYSWWILDGYSYAPYCNLKTSFWKVQTRNFRRTCRSPRHSSYRVQSTIKVHHAQLILGIKKLTHYTNVATSWSQSMQIPIIRRSPLPKLITKRSGPFFKSLVTIHRSSSIQILTSWGFNIVLMTVSLLLSSLPLEHGFCCPL